MKEAEISLYTQAPSNASGPLFSRRKAMIQPRCTAIMALCHRVVGSPTPTDEKITDGLCGDYGIATSDDQWSPLQF